MTPEELSSTASPPTSPPPLTPIHDHCAPPVACTTPPDDLVVRQGHPRSNLSPVSLEPSSTSIGLSAVDRLYGLIYLHERGLWDHDEFHRRLDTETEDTPWLLGFYEDKICFDYMPSVTKRRGVYVLRVPGIAHQAFTHKVMDAITHGIAELGCGCHPELADQLREVQELRRVTLNIRHLYDHPNGVDEVDFEMKRTPDALWSHSVPHPRLVMEVSYSSQPGKVLRRLAEDYISGVRPEEQHDDDDKTATVSVWRLAMSKSSGGEVTGYPRCDIDAVPFRTAAGEPCDGALELQTSDFLPSSRDMYKHRTLRITFADLTNFLNLAETREERINARPSPAPLHALARTEQEIEEEKVKRRLAAKSMRLELEEQARERSVERRWSGGSADRRGSVFGGADGGGGGGDEDMKTEIRKSSKSSKEAAGDG
ncbi:hypothetical protein B0A55_02283 [Friedmanniomyces simplex]|uniref:Uncharacterized protein n=1 Tax=Friedmanniomyces simplex TaxID=329884 RepID=A0A4U0XX93_9PEZI|nr:hypothetical protein B0A55_02283 [Friedmanniomyces simplex]